MRIRMKRAYDKPAKNDGYRILVDRMWPRGIKKEDANIDLWLKEIAPSSNLRKWFKHDPDKWPEFKSRYFKELEQKTEEVEELRKRAEEKTVTLIFSAKDPEYNNAVALKEYIETQ